MLCISINILLLIRKLKHLFHLCIKFLYKNRIGKNIILSYCSQNCSANPPIQRFQYADISLRVALHFINGKTKYIVRLASYKFFSK